MIASLLRPLLASLGRRQSGRSASGSASGRAVLDAGINLVGFARGGLGLGENLRGFAEALDAHRHPFALVDFTLGLGERGIDPRLDAWIRRDNPHGTNVFFINADQTPQARAHLGEDFWRGRRNIGFWFWELERFPDAWVGSIDAVDAIWTASDFVRRAIAARTDKPVHRVALPIEPRIGRRFTRTEFSLPEAPFLFLFTFDFHSFEQRKNPRAAIAAFRKAFPGDDRRAVLLIKTVNARANPERFAALAQEIGDDARILLRDEFLSHEATVGLTSVCDAFLSLHRAEGFGLGLAEAMFLGKPAIATGYSGNLDFMRPDNSCLVHHTMTPVGPGEYPMSEGQHWAAPDLEHAATLMRRLVAEPEFARAVGQAGAASIRQWHSREACVASIAEALAEA